MKNKTQEQTHNAGMASGTATGSKAPKCSAPTVSTKNNVGVVTDANKGMKKQLASGAFHKVKTYA